MTSREERLRMSGMKGPVFSVTDPEKYRKGLRLIEEAIEPFKIFASDNLITWNRNLSFLQDDFFQTFINNKNIDPKYRAIVWRLYILIYFAQIALNVEGDFMELGVLEGITVEQVLKKTNFKKSGKNYYLYDLFDWKDEYEHDQHQELKDKNLYSKVKNKFNNYNFVKIIKGKVPDTLSQEMPDKIAFAHIDMNHPDPEEGALKMILPRLSDSGIIVFDDYGWWSYSAQKKVLDPIVLAYGLSILELPTGQGLLIKNHGKS
tara:strand:+ start:5029 stop:5811 length:783 start_codon:yes stop_codon:yes gene_type:complete